MQRTIHLSLFAALLALGACSQKTPEPERTAPEPAVKSITEVTPVLEHSQMVVPYALTLTAPNGDGDGHTLELLATIEVLRDNKMPTTLSVSLPPDAKLIAGQASESIGRMAKGKLERRFTVKLGRPLTADEPVSVRLDSKLGDVMGAHAERAYPQGSRAMPRSPAVPAPPAGRPPHLKVRSPH